MAIAPGTRLGVYEIAGLIGAGGMGEVYRARDTNLNRNVAIKVLPTAFAQDAERLTRFEREARTLASLNHPNIAIVHGLEKGPAALVMELVEGPTLAHRIEQGALPVSEAVTIAKQIADALEAAHEQGIIHRDLKPANVKVRDDGTVKVLDFGLAKAWEGPARAGHYEDLSLSPTITAPLMTDVGVILGTAPYMSPEQARGRVVDKRADIWAFGCVLFEMLTGRRAFSGEGVTDTLAAVLERQPDWEALPASTPDAIRTLLQNCLQKDPKKRLRDIADARFELDAAPPKVIAASRGMGRSLVWVAVVVCCVASLGIGWLIGARSAPAPVVSRWLLDVRPATALLGGNPVERTNFGRFRPSRLSIALSPDGRMLAFTAQRDGTTRLYVRGLNEREATAVEGTDGADSPFFSPAGDWIGFWAGGAIRKVPAAGGLPVKVCDTDRLFGISWASADTIVFAHENRTIWKVSPAGGMPQQVTRTAADEIRHVAPQSLPGGAWLLYTALPAEGDWAGARVVAQSLVSNERKVLLEAAADARYVPSGHLVFMRLGTLMAAPFDTQGMRFTGPEVGLIDDVMQSVNSTSVSLDNGVGQYTFSSTGTLIYVAGELNPDFESALNWVSRDGSIQPVPLPAPARPFNSPRLSPDGEHLLLATWGMRDWSLWRYDFKDGSLARLTTEGRASFPNWSPDGSQILFRLTLNGPQKLFSLSTRGEATPRPLNAGEGTIFPGSWAPDGRSIVYADGPTGASLDLKVASLGDQTEVKPLIATRFNERMPEISPDGRWLAYVSNETGQDELYVRAYPGLGEKRRLSTNGGFNPAWSRNGRKLVFLERNEGKRELPFQLMEVDVTLGRTFTASPPRRLFDAPFPADVIRVYDLTPDAGRFIFLRETYPPSTSSPREMHVIENWFEELKQKVR